jgi:hypothetical protein
MANNLIRKPSANESAVHLHRQQYFRFKYDISEFILGT